MDNSNTHIDQFIKEKLEERLNSTTPFTLNGKKEINPAQYRHISELISHLVKSVFSEFKPLNNSDKSREINLCEIKKKLNYKDKRSVMNWCRKNEVFVISQGKNQVVNKLEFLMAFYKPMINRLKRTKTNWEQLIKTYLHGKFDDLLSNNGQHESYATYSPTSKVETSFLSKIKTL